MTYRKHSRRGGPPCPPGAGPRARPGRHFLRGLFVLFVSLWFQLAADLPPASAQNWPQWRYEPGNTALNVTESLLFPPPDLFWFSATFGNNRGVFRSAASSPVVLDLANDPENPGLADPMVFIARRENLYAYRPDLQGSFAAGAIQPPAGWPLRMPGTIVVPPVAATITQATRRDGTVTRRVLYVATGGDTSTSFTTIHCVVLDPNNPDGVAPTIAWSRRVPGFLGGAEKIAGMTFADIGSDLFDRNQADDSAAVQARWSWAAGAAEGWQGNPTAGEAVSRTNTDQDAPADPAARGSWEFVSTARNATRTLTTEVDFRPEQLGATGGIISAVLRFEKRLVAVQNLLPGSLYRWEISTNGGQSYSELFREEFSGASGIDNQWQSKVTPIFNFGTPQDHQATWRLRLTATVVTGTADATNVRIVFDFPRLTLNQLGSRSAQQSLPLLFVTMQDGQVVALHANPYDIPTASGAVGTVAGSERWKWRPAGSPPRIAAAPAVARVPLDGIVGALNVNNQDVGTQILGRNREWLVFTGNRNGEVVALEAFGQTNSGGAVSGQGKVRWQHSLPPTASGRDEVLTPPLVWNGGTGLTDANGTLLTRLSGVDDMVVVGTRAGRLYALDAQGDFIITGTEPGRPAGAGVGDPLGTTSRRWQYPDPSVPAGGVPTDSAPWDTRGPQGTNTLAPFNSPLAVWNGQGALSTPDTTSLNLEYDDDLIYARFDQNRGQALVREGEPFRFVEVVGAVRAYGRIETAVPIDPGGTLRVIAPDGAEVPRRLLAVRSRFFNSPDTPDADRDGLPDGSIAHGRITLIKQRWIDEQGAPHQIQFGDVLRVIYTPLGGSGTREEQLPFPARRRLPITPNPPAGIVGDPEPTAHRAVPVGAAIRASQGSLAGSLQAEREVVRIAPNEVPEFTDTPAPGMAVANGNLWLGSRYRGRFFSLDAEFLRITGFIRSVGDDPDTGNRDDDQPNVTDPVGSPAIAMGWLYVAHDSGVLRAFSNEGGGAPGTGSGPVSGDVGGVVPGRPRENSIEKPVIRVTDQDGTPITDEDRLVYDWGETIYLKVSGIVGEGQGFFGNLSRSPIRATLRGPMGDLPPVTVTPIRVDADSIEREATIELVVPNATSSNPMTPGTKLLKETPLSERFREPHWELRVEQVGVGWRSSLVDPNTGRAIPEGPWEPFRDIPQGSWSPNSNTAPWITLLNPIALVYNPFDETLSRPDTDPNIAYLARFHTDEGLRRKAERGNGDPYPAQAVGNFSQPRVLTVGTDPSNGRQLVFGDHGKATPSVVFGIADRSDLGVTGGRGALRVRVQGAKLTKLGIGAQLSPGGRSGSVNQNERYTDDGPDGYYPSITGDRLKVVKRGDGSNAVIAPVNLLGALTEREGPEAKPRLDPATGRPVKRLQIDPFLVSVDVPKYQPDDVYATRARVPNPQTGLFTPDTAINPTNTPYLDYVGPGTAPPNINLTQRDDGPARVTVYVDANNNGRLDLQGNYREAYRTFAVQVVVRPDFRLEVRDRTVDLGRVWHGFQTPELSEIANLPADGQAFYRSYWKPFTLVNTGNVNLPAIKPEVVMSFQGQPTRLVTLSAAGVNADQALTLVRDPSASGVFSLKDALNIYLRTSLDDLLKPSASDDYNRGPGAWLQKARVGAAAPSTAIYGGDPSLLSQPTPRETLLTLNIPTGTPLGTYVGQVRFFNDQSVQALPSAANELGYAFEIIGTPGNGLLDRVGNTTVGFRTEPFTLPTFDLRVRVTENLALGSVTSPENGGATGSRQIASRTSPAAGLDLVNRRIALFYSSNLEGLRQGRPLQYDLFGTSLRFDENYNIYPFDRLPSNPAPWGEPLVINAPANGSGAPRNTKPGFAQDSSGRGLVFWTEQASPQPGVTESRLMLRQVTPNTGEPQALAFGGSANTLGARSAPAPVVVPASAGSGEPGAGSWFLFWHGGSAQKQNLFFSRSPQPENPSSWTAEALVPTSPSLASVSDPSPTYTPETGTLWVLYTGLSQRLGKTDAYVTKLDPRALGDRRRFFGRLGFSPVTAEKLAPNATRTVYTAAGIDWVIDARNPLRVYLDDVPLLREGDVGRANSSGEVVFEVDRSRWPALYQQGVRVVADPAAGVIRFSMDTRRARTLMNLPVPPGAQAGVPADPEITADYTPGTLRLTAGPQSASSAVGFLTRTFEPSWHRGLESGDGRPVAGAADRFWVIWRRSAGVAGGGPTLYYKAFRPGIHVRRGGFARVGRENIQVLSRPDLAPGAQGASRPIPYEDVSTRDGGIWFREEFEGLARVHGVPTPVEVRYLDPHTGVQVREIHFITWRDETGEVPVPMDLSVNEGTVTAFPITDETRMVDPDSGSTRTFRRLAKIWLFWSSTRGTGSDIYQAAISPRFGPETAPALETAAGTAGVRRSGR
jgi:hypothetical protein